MSLRHVANGWNGLDAGVSASAQESVVDDPWWIALTEGSPTACQLLTLEGLDDEVAVDTLLPRLVNLRGTQLATLADAVASELLDQDERP
jgi:hypothetical protein